jgi:hypothetical protein
LFYYDRIISTIILKCVGLIDAAAQGANAPKFTIENVARMQSLTLYEEGARKKTTQFFSREFEFTLFSNSLSFAYGFESMGP